MPEGSDERASIAVTILLPPTIAARLDHYCLANARSRSQAGRLMIERALRGFQRARRPAPSAAPPPGL